MYVVEGPKIALFSRSWLHLFTLDWPSIKFIHPVVNDNASVESLTKRNKKVFSDKTGAFRGAPVKLHVRNGAIPVHHKFRSVPFAIRHKVEVELDELEKQGIISPVTHSEWATPVVPAVKKWLGSPL